MLGFKIGNEWLDLNPGTVLEMERGNPFLQFNETIQGEYSLPLEVRNTPKNNRLLKLAGMIQKRVDNKGIDVSAFDNGLQHSIGKLKIEKVSHNLNRGNEGSISLFYLTGISSFYQDIKNVKLRDVSYGGDRSFTWDDYNRSGGGFWGHIHQVVDAAPGSFDYAFFPVINKSWRGDDGQVNEVMNNMELKNGNVEFAKQSTDKKELNVIVPFPYLKYTLQQVLAHVGWKAEGAILNDPDFRKICLVNFQAIEWGFISKMEAARLEVLGPAPNGSIGDFSDHPAAVTFNLADHMPEMTVADFLIALKNRFGWFYDIDRKNKTIRIKQLTDVVGTTVKDLTYKTAPAVQKKVQTSIKVYALKNEFTGEYAGGQPNLEKVLYQGALNYLSQLPAPAKSLNGQVYLIRAENNYYICREKEGTSNDTYIWDFYAYNVYDVVPEGATDDINTKATCLGVEKYNNYLDLIPRMDNAGNWNEKTYEEATWGIHLMMYQGKRNNKAGQAVPYACSHVYDSTGNQVAAWALVFECKLFDGTEVGQYARNWKPLLDTYKSVEDLEVKLYLPKSEFMKLQFSDVIAIDNVRMYIRNMKYTVPYNGSVQLECSRI